MRSELAMPAPRLRVVGPDEPSPEAVRARQERQGRRALATLALSTAILTAGGLVMVLSASSVASYAQFGSSFLYFQRQLVSAAIGAGAFLLASKVRHQVWQRAWAGMLAGTFILLLMVLHSPAGITAGGAARWIQLGPVSIQPSELAKFAVIAGVASILAGNVRTLDREPLRWMVPILSLVGGVSLLVLLQPDLGTMMIIALTVFLLLFVAGVRLRLLATSAVIGGAIGLALVFSQGYRKARFLSFLHPWADPKNTGYQIVQSLIALGSGHLFGVGLGASRQKWAYVPNAHTDFIFAILGEELGLIGELIVLALFCALIWAGIRISLRAPDAFGRLLAAGITGWLGLQAIVNLGAVTGIMPITGVPLPFLSFGGSSLIVSLAATGVLFSIGRAGLPSAGRRPGSTRPAVRADTGGRARAGA